MHQNNLIYKQYIIFYVGSGNDHLCSFNVNSYLGALA